MRTFFSVYGPVVDCTVMVDRDSGRSKGFGFVTFEDSSPTGQLVGKLGLILDDKQVSWIRLIADLSLIRVICSLDRSEARTTSKSTRSHAK